MKSDEREAMIVHMDSDEIDEVIAAITYKMEKLHDVKRNDSINDENREQAAVDYDTLSEARERLYDALRAG